MLGRRQIREKVLQSLYAAESSKNDEHVVKQNMLKAIDEIYDLYVYLLNLILVLEQLAQHKIENNKSKKLPTPEDLKPNLKFVNNPLVHLFKINHELNEYTAKNNQLTWDVLDTFPNKLYKEMIASGLYQSYMQSKEDGFNHHQHFLAQLFETLIASNDDLFDWVEDIKLHWNDDLHIANTMVYNTIKSFTPKSNANTKLFKTFKDIEDKQFMLNLFNRTKQYDKETQQIIEKTANNWELERIAKVDLLILKMALTEMLYFPNIPPKVILNEYIELAKNYSTEKSKTFVNGILDNCLKQISQANSKQNSLDL